jgi:hypothetical protein
MPRITTRIVPLERDIRVALPPLSEESRRRTLADFARKALADGQAQNRAVLGRVPPHETYVDHRKSEDIDSVRVDGEVRFEFDLLIDVNRWISEQLRRRSPFGRGDDVRAGHPGLYRRSHIMVMRDHIVPIDTPIPPDVDSVFFANTVPYARKIERGLSRQTPTGVYEEVVAAASKRYGNIASIYFGYRSLQVGGIDAWAARTNMTARGRGPRSRTRHDWLRRQPAIIVVFK